MRQPVLVESLSGDTAALREMLLRVDGRVPKEANRMVPPMVLNLQQVVQGSRPAPPVAMPRASAPANGHARELSISFPVPAVEVEAEPIDPDEDDEEADDD